MTTNTNAVLAQLRHLYANMMGGEVRDTAQTKRMAQGLLAPAIEALEQAALTTAAAVPPEGFVMVPKVPDERMERAIAAAFFGTVHEARKAWVAGIAAAPKAEPVPAGEYPPLPDPHGLGILKYAGADMRAYVDADRAMRAQAAPKQEAGTYHLGACITDGMLHATVMRKAPGSAGAVTVLLSEAIPVASLQDHDVIVDAAPVAQGDALIDFIESAGSVHIHRVRAGFNGPIRWDVEYGYEDAKVSGRTLRDALSGVLKAGAASAAKELGA